MSYDELIEEHENIVSVLTRAVQVSPLPALRKLLEEQAKELANYKRERGS